MPEKLLDCVKEWRKKGAGLSDEEADAVYKQCLRKMEVAKIENPEEYIFLLYPDEIKNYIFRRTVNAVTMLRQIGKEFDEDVFNM